MGDDAQGTVFALLDREETTAGVRPLRIAMRALWGCEPCEGWIERYGIPKALYVDFKNVYITTREPTIEEQLRGEDPLTQFGKACKKLGIEILGAHSPQAKAVQRLRDVSNTVSEWLDGSIHLLYKGCELQYRVLPERPERPTPPKVRPSLPRKKPTPGPDHPWRRWQGEQRINPVCVKELAEGGKESPL